MPPRCPRLIALLLLHAVACGGGLPEPPERIVLVVVDTLRADALSCCGRHGSAAQTPVADALAARGQVLENAVGSFYQTTMSMGALFTGRTPSLESGDPAAPLSHTGSTWCGLARLAGADETTCIPRAVATLGEVLKGAGYWTIGVTSNSLLFAPFGAERGFDDWSEVGDRVLPFETIGPEERLALDRSRAAPQVNAAAARALARRAGDRFFLYVHYMDAHDYRLASGRPAYLRGVEAADRGLGGLLAGLEAEGLLEDAVVILTADHGQRLGESHFVPGRPGHGGNPAFQEMLRVPLIVAPAVFDEDRLPVRSEDLFRRIAGLAGAPVEAGVDLLPDELFLTEPEWQTYQRGGFKSFLRRRDGRRFLVDLSADAGERRDAASRHPEVSEAHAQRMAELAFRLAAPGARPGAITPEEEALLRAQGYVE